jgi:hypothetical protein
LEDKVAEFRQFSPTNAQIVPYRTTPRANGKSTLVLRFRVSSPRLYPVYNLLYPRRERRITTTALDMLGAQAAAWLWAEGARPQRNGDYELARVGCSEEEAQLVAQWLTMLTGASSELLQHYTRPRLHFTPKQATKIRDALHRYAPQSRLHLFREEIWDVSSIRSSRSELLLGQGEDQPEGFEEAALAGTQAH